MSSSDHTSSLPLERPTVHTVAARDGVELAVAVYHTMGEGPVPALLAASPYRFDNDELPDIPAFMFRETGPIGFYVEQGYAYVRLDVRGTGRSGGVFEFLGPSEQQDLYDVIEWIAAQPWCTGRIGGSGQSYFCMAQ
ncbi:CocE/NonD family hydrolase [Sphingomonas sp.]|uniref:CocE/NonD family hydrolase n=1 Tax=Sphingomonas sp. TaxID=28214 RepID=UPI003B0058F7